MSLKERIKKILDELKKDLYERDEIISVSLLSALAEQNIFLFGPPGTAKSLISRRLSKAFETDNYFEHLMQRFSTPEEVFGPVSISELKKDNYKRKTEGFLPEAEFAFLDEIWKSSPAILNTLLTIINEKVFKNGSELKKVPLKVLISASNETPPDNQGLDALYDRFTTRLFVPPITERNNFETILQNGSSKSEITISNDLIIKNNEWNEWKELINTIKLSDDTLNIINAIKIEIDNLNKKDKKSIIYVSDRRWQKAALLLKASAFFCDREETNIADCLLLSHCLWTKEDNRKKIEKIVTDVIKTNGFQTGISLSQLDKDKEQLEEEINKELFYSKDVYKTKKNSR
jgi:MoxR-like ATPase